jgi:predicted  nucleic acid-binding Zn-ribbon protein
MATDSPSLEQQWKTLFSNIIEQAQQALTEKPSLKMIEAFQALSAQLEGLREQIPTKEQALEDFSGQLEALEAYLLKLSQQGSFDLQHLDKLLSHWYLSAYQPDSVEDINRVSQDIDRVSVEVAPLAEDYQRLSQQINEQIATLASLSLEEQQHTFAQLTGINEQRATLKQKILNHASPFQQTFDSETDYLSEWLTLTSELRQPALETPTVSADMSANEQSDNRSASETTKVGQSTASHDSKTALETPPISADEQSDNRSASEASKLGQSTAGDDLKNTPPIEKSDTSKLGQSTTGDDLKNTPPIVEKSDTSKLGQSTTGDDLKNTPPIEKSDTSKLGQSTAGDDLKNTPPIEKSDTSKLGQSTTGDDLKNTPAIVEKSDTSKVGQSTTGDDLKNTPPIVEKSDTSKLGQSTAGDDLKTTPATKNEVDNNTKPHNEPQTELTTAVKYSSRSNQNQLSVVTLKTIEVLDQIAEDLLLKADKSSQEIAKMVPFLEQQHPEYYFKGLNALVWRLITDNRLGLAYHIAQMVEKLYSKEQCAVPAIMLKTLALSQLVHSSSIEVNDELQSDIPQITSFFQQKTTAQSDQTSYNLLGFALVLRPALIAPVATGANELLSQLSLSEAFQPLSDLCQAILEYTGLGLALTPDILKGVGEQARWSESLQSLQSKAEDWLNTSRKARFKYVPTTNVWKHWLKESEPLAQMLTAVIQDERDKQPQVEQTINAFSSTNKVHQLLHQTDQELRGRRANLKPIYNNAATTVYNHVQNALQFAQEWLNLLQTEPQQVNNFIHEQATQCRTKIITYLQQSQTQLQAFLQQHSPRLELAASVAAANRALQELQALFDPQQTENTTISWQHILHAELLRLPRLTLDETWQRPAQLSHREFLASLINLLQTEQSVDWDKAFEEQCEVCNHLATQRLIEFLKQAQRHKTPDALKSLEKRRENNLLACRRSLESSINEAREKIERATVAGGLAETERLNWLSTLDKMLPADILDFHPSFNAITNIAEQIKNTKKKQIQKLRYELQESATQIKPEDSQRIKAALDKGDVLIANEYLAMAKAGSPLPENENTRDAFSDFFPQFVEKLMSVLDQRKDHQNLNDIANRKGFYPLDMRPVPGAQAKTAAEMLEAWLAVKKHNMGNNIIDRLQQILDGIGFQNSQLTRQEGHRTDDRHRWFEMRVRPLMDRDICVIPTFSSTAQGYYRLLCLWERPSEEEILSLIARQARDIPIIVFYFGRLTTKRRRDLAELCRDGRRTLLVVDETLIYFLCGERGLRLPILFQCAFPFTVVANPFTTTGSNVPVEMFFGRGWQRESIFDRFGTNLIYGGRQLGKTALLREVKRQSHNPDEGIIVLWIDLKAENIGTSRPPEEIWLVIAQALQQQGIISPSVRQPEIMSTEIQAWLNIHPQRRILLLLDEADGFLSQEAKDDSHSGNHFQTLIRLKNLMETTERYFKVVFAGLHNVQRTARDINTPLAHLGTPVCIGPMLGDGEEREAKKLLTLPFFMLGYSFDPPELPNRILGLTNYYPNLIQLFCWHLLEHLTDKNKAHFDARESPPYLIQAHHIDEAYQRQELRKAIIDRFKWTLDLDPRYRVIALQIALETLVRRQQGLLYEGFEVNWVKTEALSLWPQGFKDQTYEAFRTLLDEMIGLGVLRKVGHLYDLRSPNVINLLGTQNEIEEALLDAAEKQPPLVFYEAASFRSALPTDHWQRSPLTWQQESDIFAPQNGVAVLFGAPIAGISEVKPFLECAAQSSLWAFEVLDTAISPKEFQTILQASLQHNTQSQLILIPLSAPWTHDKWVYEVILGIQAIKPSSEMNGASEAHFRVLFIGGCQEAWAWVNARVETRQTLNSITRYSLQPWQESAVRQWMNDTGLGHDASHVDEVTGNWGHLLHEMGLKSQHTPNRWAEHLDDIEKQLNQSPETGLPQLDLIDDAVVPVLKVMGEASEPMTIEDIAVLSEQPEEFVEKVIEWADLLSFVKQHQRDTWLLDKIVARLVTKIKEGVQT